MFLRTPERSNLIPAPRHPTSNHPHANQDTDLMTSREYLAMQENANSRKNIAMANSTYERVMGELANKEGHREVYESLKDAPSGRLKHLVEKFFQVVRRPNREVYASGTLHTLWSNIAHILATREVDPVDIRHNPLFQTAREILAKRANESAKEGRGPGVQAKNPIKPEHFQKALEEGAIGRANPRALLCLTHTTFVVGFGLRPGTECHMVTNGDLTYGPVDEKYGRPDWIRLNPRVTKTRKGRANDKREIDSKVFPNDDQPEICYVRTIVAYQMKKKPGQKQATAQFFLNPHQEAQKNPEKYNWYVGDGLAPGRQAGIHQLERLMTDALSAVGIDCKAEGYSAYSVRKSMFQGGADGNVDDITLSRYGGQKSTMSKRAYINSNDVHHKAASMTIQQRIFNNDDANYGTLIKKVEAKSRGDRSSKVSQERRDTRSPDRRKSRSSSQGKSRRGDRRESWSGQSKSRSKYRSRSRQRETRSKSRRRRTYSNSRRRSMSSCRGRSRSKQRKHRRSSRQRRINSGGRRRSCRRSGGGSRSRVRSKSRQSRGKRSWCRSNQQRSRSRSTQRRSRSRSRQRRSWSRSRQRRSRSRSRQRRSRSSVRSKFRLEQRSRGGSRRSSSSKSIEESTENLKSPESAPYQDPYASVKTIGSTSLASKPGATSHVKSMVQDDIFGGGGGDSGRSTYDGQGNRQRMLLCSSCATEV